MKKSNINTALAGYAQADYSPESWTILYNAKTIGDTNIDNAASVADVMMALNNTQAAMAAVTTLLDDAKAAAHSSLNDVLTGYAQADYSPENWTILMNAKTTGDTNNAACVAGVAVALINAQAAMAAVPTLLADAKVAAHTGLVAALALYTQADYVPDDWTALTEFYAAGDAAIDAAADLCGVEAAQLEATAGMDSVETIAQTLAAAKAAAHDALAAALGTYTACSSTVDAEIEEAVVIDPVEATEAAAIEKTAVIDPVEETEAAAIEEATEIDTIEETEAAAIEETAVIDPEEVTEAAVIEEAAVIDPEEVTEAAVIEETAVIDPVEVTEAAVIAPVEVTEAAVIEEAAVIDPEEVTEAAAIEETAVIDPVEVTDATVNEDTAEIDQVEVTEAATLEPTPKSITPGTKSSKKAGHVSDPSEIC